MNSLIEDSAARLRATGITPQIFASRPSQGAHLVG